MCYGNQTWSEEYLMRVYNVDDLHGGGRSSEVKCGKLYAMATKLGKKNPWYKFMMMMTFMKVKGHQRSNVVNFALWLPNLVKRIANASLKWWWPSWRSKVIRGQMQKLCAMATKLNQKKPWCKFMMMMTFVKLASAVLLTKFGSPGALFNVFDPRGPRGPRTPYPCKTFVATPLYMLLTKFGQNPIMNVERVANCQKERRRRRRRRWWRRRRKKP